MGNTLEKLLKWMDSPEGQKKMEEERKKMQFIKNLTNKWIEKFHNLSTEKRSEIIGKIIAKYESDKYRDKEMFKMHYEPRCTLYWYLDDYAEKYGEELPEEKDNPFPHHLRLIDGKFIIRKMYGQGTVIDVWYVDEK